MYQSNSSQLISIPLQITLQSRRPNKPYNLQSSMYYVLETWLEEQQGCCMFWDALNEFSHLGLHVMG